MFRYEEELQLGQAYYDMTENMRKMGLNTVIDDQNNPVLDDEMNPVKPDVIVRARLEALNVQRSSFNSYLGNTAVSSIEWTFIDQITKDTIHQESVSSKYEFESSDVNNAIPSVFMESYYALVNKNRPLLDTLSKHSVKAAEEKKRIASLPPPAPDTISIDSTSSDSLSLGYSSDGRRYGRFEVI